MNHIKNYCRFFVLFCSLTLTTSCSFAQQVVTDDFEGGGTITTWAGDDCGINTSFSNPYQTGINTSPTVLQYNDTGGTFANVRFDVGTNFDLTVQQEFSLKIYVPSSGLTGNQPNQVSLKLQDGTVAQPWLTQSEIIKSITLDEWQTVTFNFEFDSYINLDPGSPPPVQRTDFNRVVIQVNGEGNNDLVLAYLDDIDYYEGTNDGPVYDTLVWSDEFDLDGPVDPGKWFHQTLLPNGVSWYNGEIQHYTDRIDNSVVENGVLKIIAKKETFTDQGETKNYTSARLNSKYTFTYGRVEIRAKLPTGVGTWPALWMLGKNINEPGAYWQTEGFGTTPWPDCGEIDIMEHWGDNQNYVSSATHTPSSFGNTVNVGGQTIATASTAFHVYSLEWTPDELTFQVDGVTHFIYDPAVKDSNTWPFDDEQYFIFNVAILPNIDPSFTQSAMEVDYIRVYQESALSLNNPDELVESFLYPNPTTGKVKIVLTDPSVSELSIEIFSEEGRMVKRNRGVIYENQVEIDFQNYPDGIYFLKYTYEGKSGSKKVIKR